jgi:membrane-bound lytic murein transglycosylase D
MWGKLKIKYFFVFGATLLLIFLFKILMFDLNNQIESDLNRHYFENSYRSFFLNVPHDLNFAGEVFPVDNLDVRETLDKSLSDLYAKNQIKLLYKKSMLWFPVIEPVLEKHGIPDDFKYIVIVESGFSNAISPKGAAGFWQLVEPTAISYGLEVNEEIDERLNVEKSTEVACKYIKDAHKRLGSWTLAAAAYNRGINALEKQIEKQETVDYYSLILNEQTSKYLFKIIAIKEIFTHPSNYGIVINQNHANLSIPAQLYRVDTTIHDLFKWCEAKSVNFQHLTTINPWIKSNTLYVDSGKTFWLKVPGEKFNNFYRDFPWIESLKQISKSEEEE